MKKGYFEKYDSEYIRHGTCCLIANLEIATVKIISPTLIQTRNETDFLLHISETVKLFSDDKCIFVTDNLNTHMSESLVKYVADLESSDKKSLGKKGFKGIPFASGITV